MKKIRFIINPIAGIRREIDIPHLIYTYADQSKFIIEIERTQYAGHAIELAKKAVIENVNCVVAVGGDGSVNEIASQLAGTDTILGIIPLGSGNGLALKLGISTKIPLALDTINQFKVKAIDTAKINDAYFFSNAGSGIEAHVVDQFSRTKTRGLFEYIRIAWHEFNQRENYHYIIRSGNKKWELDALSFHVGNSGQYGYNVSLSPHSKLDDGLLEICTIKPMSFIVAFFMTPIFLMGYSYKTPIVKITQVKEASIEISKKVITQRDGDPHEMLDRFYISIQEKNLLTIIP